MSKILRNIAAVFFIGPFAAMLAEPFYQAVLSRFGVDTSQMAGPVVAAIFDLFSSTWFRLAAFFSMGAGLGVWMHWLAIRRGKHRKDGDDAGWRRIYADIPTSIRMQFEQGSESTRQISNANVQRFHGQRAAFHFSGEDGSSMLEEKVIWWMFLIFKRPTVYGQIIVDAGNAKIPKYRVVDSTYFGAVLMFDGDIGNVALEIKCIPANPAALPSHE